MTDALTIAGRQFRSRLIVGTGKYRSFPETARALESSGAEIVTVAVRRVNLTDRSKESLLDYIDREKIFILPKTAACYNQFVCHGIPQTDLGPVRRCGQIGTKPARMRPKNALLLQNRPRLRDIRVELLDHFAILLLHHAPSQLQRER